jgi:hypothetical protein
MLENILLILGGIYGLVLIGKLYDSWTNHH